MVWEMWISSTYDSSTGCSTLVGLLDAPPCCRERLLQFDERVGVALVGSWWTRHAGGLFGASLEFWRLLDQGRPE